jgi:CheY-like chemotaxis protein
VSKRFTRATILVVDDEEVIRLLAAAFLEDFGFTAVQAWDSASALAILEARSDIRVMFTDINMPGKMNGVELAATVQLRWPSIDLMITSGRGRPLFGVPARCVFFPKPYLMASVISTATSMIENADEADRVSGLFSRWKPAAPPVAPG